MLTIASQNGRCKLTDLTFTFWHLNNHHSTAILREIILRCLRILQENIQHSVGKSLCSVAITEKEPTNEWMTTLAFFFLFFFHVMIAACVDILCIYLLFMLRHLPYYRRWSLTGYFKFILLSATALNKLKIALPIVKRDVLTNIPPVVINS